MNLKKNTRIIYIGILFLYHVCKTAKAFAVTISEDGARPAAFKSKEIINDKAV